MGPSCTEDKGERKGQESDTKGAAYMDFAFSERN